MQMAHYAFNLMSLACPDSDPSFCLTMHGGAFEATLHIKKWKL